MPEPPDPFLRPGPGPFLGIASSSGRKIIKPGKAVKFPLEGRIWHLNVPDHAIRRFNHAAREQELSGTELASTFEASNHARLRQANEGGHDRFTTGTAHMVTVHLPSPKPLDGFGS